jgi:hypothetical protein
MEDEIMMYGRNLESDRANDVDGGDVGIFAYEFSDEALEAAAGDQWMCTTISGEGSQTSECGTYNNGCC